MIMSTKEICKRGLSMTISLTLGNTGLPAGDRLPGDTELLGKLLLGQPQVPAQLQQRIPCLHSIASFLPSIADRLRMHKQRAVAEFLPLCSILERLWKDCLGTMGASERSASP